jgi:ER lumen protein retaining receptor
MWLYMYVYHMCASFQLCMSNMFAGISGKSQILFAVVYTTRYLDLLTSYVSMYNTVMKVIFTGVSYATIYSMYVVFKKTYDQNHDTFW